MAVIAVTPARVAVLYPQQSETYDMIAAEAITPGQLVYRNSAGKAALASGAAAATAGARGLALNAAGAGQAVSVLVRGVVAGFTLPQAYDATVFVSGTAGALDDAAALVSSVVGRVVNTTDSTLAKAVAVDLSF